MAKEERGAARKRYGAAKRAAKLERGAAKQERGAATQERGAAIKVAVRQFNEIHEFVSSFIFSTMVFCTGVLQYAFVCLSINNDYSKFQSLSIS